MGELQAYSFPNPKLIHPFIKAGVNFEPVHALNLSIEYIKGSISGVDSLSPQSYSQLRNLHFQSIIDAINFTAAISLFNFREKFHITPYLLIGIGVFHFSPQAKLGNTWYDLQPLGTEGQYISDGNYPEPYKLWQLNIPGGLGIHYKVTKAIGIKFEATYHKTFTDYLDDVSGSYPDMDELAESTNGDLAVLFSNRSNTFVNETVARGNPAALDGFVHFNLALTLNLEMFQKKTTKQKYNSIIKESDCKKLQKRLKI
jgi:hypothetical protein